MPATVEMECAGCGTQVIVFPSSLYGLVPGNVEDGFMAHLHERETEDGRRFAVGDAVGAWRCPACGHAGLVAVVDFN